MYKEKIKRKGGWKRKQREVTREGQSRECPRAWLSKQRQTLKQATLLLRAQAWASYHEVEDRLCGLDRWSAGPSLASVAGALLDTESLTLLAALISLSLSEGLGQLNFPNYTFLSFSLWRIFPQAVPYNVSSSTICHRNVGTRRTSHFIRFHFEITAYTSDEISQGGDPNLNMKFTYVP